MATVLFVDDDPTYRRLVEKKLNEFFAEKLQKNKSVDVIDLLLAEDGKEAIELIKKNDISLLVTDLKMPKINGLLLLSYMNDHFPNIPCIVITSQKNPELKERLVKDVVHYLEKPFNPSALGEKILSTLRLGTSEKSETAMSGVSLASFLQILEMEMQSCILKIETTQMETGYFCFKEGKLYDAVFGEYKGEEATIRMIPLKSNRIQILELPPNPKKRISIDYLMPLIARALKAVEKKGKARG